MSTPSKILSAIGRGGLSLVISVALVPAAAIGALAEEETTSTESSGATTAFWEAPSEATSVTLSSTLTTYGVRAGSAGGDFLGISNTNYDINKGTNSSGNTAYDTISDLTSSTSDAAAYLSTYWGAGLGIWGTSLNENPNAFYANLYYNIVNGTYSTAGAAGLSAATTWMANPETSSWGDSDGSTSYKADGNTTISGLEYEPDIIWGANKTTAWNLESDGSNSSTNIYDAESTDSSYNPTYVTNDATNLWTQIYTMGQLASTADELTASSDKTTRYDSSSATTSALAYEKITRGQLLYIASLVDAGTIKKKTVAYLYAIDSDGVGYFFTPTASGLVSSNDTGEGAEDESGSVSNSASSAKDEYGANNSTINMGYMATLPFVTNTFDSGDELSGGIVMKVEDIYSANPTCTVSSSSSSDVMADVDVVIFNSSTADSLSGTSGGKNSSGIEKAETLTVSSVTSFCGTYGLKDDATVIAGDDFGTSTNQGTSSSTYTTTDGTAPMLYCARNYTADKDTRAAWGFAAVFPELYGNNNDATYGYWVDKIYHVNTDSVASVVQYMTNQSDTVTYTSDTASMIEEYAEAGYSWWASTGVNDSAWARYAYYNGSSRASYYGGGTDAEEPTDTIGIFAPSSIWTAAHADIDVAVSSGSLAISGDDASAYISAITSVTTADGTSLSVDSSGTIDVSSLADGTYAVTIAATGYTDVTVTITVSSSAATDATVESGTADTAVTVDTEATDCFWEAPSSTISVTLSSTLTTYGVRAGSAGGDFLGISNTNYDINKGTNSAGNTAYDTIGDLTSSTSDAAAYLSTYWGAGLGIWGTSLNENPNAFYANLYYNIVNGTYSTAGAAGLSAATTWMANPETSSWGDSDNSTSTDVNGNTTISGLEYEPDIIWGANKTTAWNLKSDGSNSSTNIYTAESADSSYNPTYVTNDATNLWTQIYTMGQLAMTADDITGTSDKTTRYDSSSATTSALAYEKITRGQLLYIASLIDAGTIEKKTVAYLYAIDSDGTAYFFTPTASGLLTGDDTGGEDISPTLGDSNSSASGADDNYASNNSTINMGYMATLPFVTNTFDSGDELTNGITMKVEDIYKENPVCTVSSSSSSSVMADVDVVIFNSSTASSLLGTSGGKNSSGITNAAVLTVSSVTSFCQSYGLTADATVIAGDDFGTSTNQGTSSSTYTTADGTAPMLYCARNYTADKDTRAAWGFAAVFPELYGNNNDATYGYWVNKIYHVSTTNVASVVKYMTNQSDAVTYTSDTASMIEEYAEAGYKWWTETGVNDSDWSGYAYYNGSSRASWYGGGTAAEEPSNTIGIFAPSSLWQASEGAVTTLTSSAVSVTGSYTYTGSAITPTVTYTDGTTTSTLTAGTDYTADYSDNVNAGTCTVMISGIGAYTGKVSKTFTIAKASNPIKVTAKAVTVKGKYKKNKLKKNVTVKKAAIQKKITVKGAQGTVTYKGLKNVTFKKGKKKGTKVTLTVKVTAAGNSNYNAATKTVKVKVTVK